MRSRIVDKTLRSENFYLLILISKNMSKDITISDEIYERLKKEKDGKSFSEVIEKKLDSGEKIEEVAGKNILDRETMEKVKKDIREGSHGSQEDRQTSR